jgi:beta-glucosidase-like glycosyl hydrolase
VLDFVPFAELADLPIAMTAHVVVNAADSVSTQRQYPRP